MILFHIILANQFLFQLNHCLPERIIVYRDGVGDGQLYVVSSYEVQQLSECFGFFGEDYKPKMAVIVVQKRINMRVFAAVSFKSADCQNSHPIIPCVLSCVCFSAHSILFPKTPVELKRLIMV